MQDQVISGPRERRAGVRELLGYLGYLRVLGGVIIIANVLA